jgi:DNA-binding NarL/FixJ family response regulator
MATSVRQGPTRRQLEVLRAYIEAGSITGAAHELDIAESTARQHLSGLYRRTGCLNAAQAAYWLGSGFWRGPHRRPGASLRLSACHVNHARAPRGP